MGTRDPTTPTLGIGERVAAAALSISLLLVNIVNHPGLLLALRKGEAGLTLISAMRLSP
jgi:hypothetical protein